MIDTSRHFEDATIIKDVTSNKIKHMTSELDQLVWEELKDDDMIEVSHKIGMKSNSDSGVYESRKISFKDLCHAIRVNLMFNGVIPFDGED